MVWNWSGGVFWVSKHLSHDIRPSRNHFWKIFKKSKSGSKMHFLQAKQDFACKNTFLVLIQKLTSPTIWVIRANPCIQSNFRSISKTSRDRFFILSLLFEKNYFLHPHASEGVQTSCKLLIFEVKNDFVGWKNSIFLNSFQTFPDGVELVWGCLPGLQTSFPWY